MIKHPFKKLVSIALSAVMIMGMSVTALASSPQTDGYHTSILTDNSSVRISQTSDDNFTYIATYDKSTGTIQLTQTSNTTGAQKVGDIAPIKPQTRASLEEKTFTNYEYEITYGSPNTWELRRPGDNAFNWVYFKTKETSKNRSYLTTFRSAVDKINVQEGAIVGTLGMSALSVLAAGAAGAGAIFTGGTLSAAAWGAILSAAGFSTAYVSTCMAYDQSCKDAYDAYWNTYYNSTIL